MARKPTYKELEHGIKGLEKKVVKRKRVREALGEFREFKEKIISESPIGMSIYDASGQCIAANDSIAELIGATRNQVLEQNYNSIESWKKSGLFDKAKSAVRQNSKKRHELKVKSTFGKDVSLDCHLVPFSSEGQNHLLLMINDISERLRAEEALKIITDEKAVLLASVPAMIFWIDKEGNFIRVNEPFAAALKKLPDEISGKSLFDLYPEDQARKYHSDNLKVIESGIPKKNIEEPVQTPACTVWVCTDKIPYRDKEGNVAGIIGFSVDITDRKLAEEALRESEEKYKSLVESSLTGIFIHQDGKYVFMNDRFAKIHGYIREELLGKEFLTLIHPDERDAKGQLALSRLKGEAVPELYEVRRLRKDGKTIWCEMIATRIEWRGRPAIMGNIVDVSERKQTERQVSERQAALEARTKELEEVNTALTVLLKRRKKDKTELEEKVLSTVKELVLPYAEKLKKSPLNAQQKAYLDRLELNLGRIVSPFAYTLSSKLVGLTSREIQVAKLVKDGKIAKEIAELLCMSLRTVESHKKSIRKKLRIKNSKINLKSYLLSV